MSHRVALVTRCGSSSSSPCANQQPAPRGQAPYCRHVGHGSVLYVAGSSPSLHEHEEAGVGFSTLAGPPGQQAGSRQALWRLLLQHSAPHRMAACRRRSQTPCANSHRSPRMQLQQGSAGAVRRRQVEMVGEECIRQAYSVCTPHRRCACAPLTRQPRMRRTALSCIEGGRSPAAQRPRGAAPPLHAPASTAGLQQGRAQQHAHNVALASRHSHGRLWCRRGR